MRRLKGIAYMKREKIRGRRKHENAPRRKGQKKEGRKGVFFRKRSESAWGCQWKMEKMCTCLRAFCVYALLPYVWLCMCVCVCMYVCKCTSVVSIHQKLGETVNCKMGERTQRRITIAWGTIDHDCVAYNTMNSFGAEKEKENVGCREIVKFFFLNLLFFSVLL